MSPIACRLAVVTVLLLTTIETMPAAPSAQQQPSSQLPAFRTHTSLVLIDASVVDKSGRFVSDLDARDFQLLEDGELRPVESLQLIELSRTSGMRLPASATAATAPSSDETMRQDGRTPETGALYILAFDDLHIRMEGTPAARKAAEDFVKTVPRPGDLVILVVTSGGKVTGPTTNSAEILEALKRVSGKKLPSPLTSKAVDRESWVALRINQARDAIRALTSAVQWAGRLNERRKALVLVSEGVDPANAKDRVAANTTDPANTKDFVDSEKAKDLDFEIKSLVGVANRANVSLYPLNPRGGAFDIASTNEATSDLMDEQRSSQEVLKQLALNTDGAAFQLAPDFGAAFRRIRDDSSTYYLLAFRPASIRAGEHRIDVRVKRPGLRVRWRPSYDDRVPLPSTSSRALTETAPAPRPHRRRSTPRLPLRKPHRPPRRRPTLGLIGYPRPPRQRRRPSRQPRRRPRCRLPSRAQEHRRATSISSSDEPASGSSPTQNSCRW